MTSCLACQGPADKTTYVKFSSAPAATFSDSLGNAVYRGTQSADPLLLDYNQPPTAISLSPSSVAENAAVGTTVGTLSVADPDGDAPVYTLSSACSGVVCQRRLHPQWQHAQDGGGL